MSATDNGGPAFPVSTGCNDGHLGHQDGPSTWQFPGMTLRDWFAAMAMQALIQTKDHVLHKHTPEGTLVLPARQGIPVIAYEYADEMLKAREA